MDMKLKSAEEILKALVKEDQYRLSKRVVFLTTKAVKY
jgi:hypothetical protein